MHIHIKAIMTILLLGLLCIPALSFAEEWPSDAHDVAAAILQRMSGDYNEKSNIHFDKAGEQAIEGDGGGYLGFEGGNAFLLYYSNDAKGKTYNAELLGLYNISDKYLRTAAVRFWTEYKVMWKDILVKNCISSTVSPPTIEIQVFCVPAEAFNDAAAGNVTSDWETLYAFAAKNAYREGQSKAPRQYYVLSFVMSKLPESAKVEPIVSVNKSAKKESQNDAATFQKWLDYDGWRVHMFASKFEPSTMRGRFYVNYYYTPGQDIPESERERILAARFDSKL